MRVLHLIDDAGPQPSGTTLALLAESLGRLGRTEQHVLLLGGSSLGREAVAAGVTDAQRVGVPWGRAVLGWPGATAALRRIGDVDLIHCWSIGAFTLASLARRRTPRILTLTTTPTADDVRWLRVLVGTGDAGRAVILAISSTIRRAVLSGGLPEERVHVLRPGLDMGRALRADRRALRESWGVESDDVKVVALLSDPPRAADAWYATMAVGLAEESYDLTRPGHPRLILLAHPDQHRRRRAEQVHRDVGRAGILIQEHRLTQPWSVLPGCDAALAVGDAGGGLSLLWAMASNIPIVGEATYAVSEVLEDRHSALLVKPGARGALSTKVRQLIDDTHLAWKLRDTARHEAYSFFSRQRYCQSLQSVYEQTAAARPVEVPAMEPTGGLRFTGRA
ncbi:MAG: glycosyltransferase [Planctomycetes bacterium]|nr:glycosyltransferase [Planctomycetota bacterium]